MPGCRRSAGGVRHHCPVAGAGRVTRPRHRYVNRPLHCFTPTGVRSLRATDAITQSAPASDGHDEAPNDKVRRLAVAVETSSAVPADAVMVQPQRSSA